jgi:hypothetical protein
MLFGNVNQYNKAKKSLLENNNDVDLVFNLLKKDTDFKNLSEGELKSSLMELNEGLVDKVTNFLSASFGGDISKIKTALVQMKEQELKFNQEEYEIWKEYDKLLQDRNQLERDKKNPDYDFLNKQIKDSMNALNTRMQELAKAHDEIFNALETKVKSLAEDSKRKKKYFNAQRALDVKETRLDRYEKIKSLTGERTKRSNDLLKFFGIDAEEAKNDVEKATREAQTRVDNLNTPPSAPASMTFDESPEKELHEEFEKIKNAPGGFYAKRRDIEALKHEIESVFDSDDFKTYSEKKQKALSNLYLLSKKLYDYLEREASKIS